MSIRRKLLKFYKKNQKVLEYMIELCEDREVAFRYENGAFGKRPSIIQNTGDIISLVESGVLSFHASEERWTNPLMLKDVKRRKELDELRKGWDFIIDLDSEDFRLSKLAAIEIIKLLEEYGVTEFGIKFSGGKGFHISISWEAFPEKFNDIDLRKEFPEVPRILASFIAYKIEKELKKEIINKLGEEYLINKNIDPSNFSPFQLVNIDTILISPRHLFRLPYSINEKTNLLSIPLEKKEVKFFNKEEAKIENVEFRDIKFIVKTREKIAKKLLASAIIWSEANEIEKRRLDALLKKGVERKIEDETKKEIEKDRKILKKIKKFELEYFPPCIKNILNGLEDGRKRAVFILINFLANVGWSWDEIEEVLKNWNEKNYEPLKERYIEYQIKWHKDRYKKGLKYITPSCDNKDYYKDLGVCNPDDICSYIKNPLQYPFMKYKQERVSKGEKRRKEKS